VLENIYSELEGEAKYGNKSIIDEKYIFKSTFDMEPPPARRDLKSKK
jgi:hypothetical protein